MAAIGTYQPGELPPVIDVEDDAGLAPATVASRVRAWVDRVQAALGVAPIVYTGKYCWRDEVGGPASFAPRMAFPTSSAAARRQGSQRTAPIVPSAAFGAP